jgi:hypothetical protein
MRRGAKIMFICAVLFPAAALLAAEDDAPGPLLLLITTFLAGLAWLLFSWMFNDNVAPVETRARRKELRAARERSALGAPPFSPPASFGQQPRSNTAKLYQPPSVTENTTKLLDKDS